MEETTDSIGDQRSLLHVAETTDLLGLLAQAFNRNGHNITRENAKQNITTAGYWRFLGALFLFAVDSVPLKQSPEYSSPGASIVHIYHADIRTANVVSFAHHYSLSLLLQYFAFLPCTTADSEPDPNPVREGRERRNGEEGVCRFGDNGNGV